MKHIIFLITIFLFFSCSKDYEEYIQEYIPEVESQDVDLNYYLDKALEAAYSTHQWMSEEGCCIENDCCWEYVDTILRAKYESGERLSTEEKEEIIKGIESSPSYLDTLDEYDEFYSLYCYKHFGPEYFIPYIDEEE